MNNTLSINIRIDNRVYPLVVDRTDEKRYRDAAKELNELIQSFREDYPDKDSQDVIAMAAFQVVFRDLVNRENESQTPLINDLKEIRDDVAEFLEERKR